MIYCDTMAGCSYTFPEDHPDAVSTDRQWECPHPAHDSAERCVFHLTAEQKDALDIDHDTVARALERCIEDRGRRNKEFVGARFRDLDLSHYVFKAPDNYPLDLSHACITGDLDLSHSDFFQPLLLERSSIEGQLLAENTTFNSYVRFNGTTIQQYADLSDTVFGSSAQFRDTAFLGRGTEPDYPDFVASFSRTTIQGRAIFHGARFQGRVDMRGSTITDIRFHDNLVDTMFFGGSSIQSISVTAPRTREDRGYISFARADIDSGVLNQPYYMEDGEARYPDESLFYDMNEATIGRVRLEPDADGDVTQYFHLTRTEFDDFDFSGHEQYLAPDWSLHQYTGPALPENNVHGELGAAPDQPPEEVEETYVRARKAAKAAEHTQAASEFFRHQIRHRKYRHLADMWDSAQPVAQRAQAGGRYLAHHLNGMVSGHFERPWRVVASSLLLTFICALLYPAIGGIQTGSGVIEYSYGQGLAGILPALQESLYFSTITATTLGYGDMTPIGIYARQLAGWEARLGTLLMALFIFVLGRRVS